MSELPPPPLGSAWNQWGERLNEYLQRVRDKLSFKTSDSRAAQDGALLWDAVSGHPVVSVNGVWQPLAYGENDIGEYAAGAFADFTTQAASTVDTPTAITWGTTYYSSNVAVDGTTTSRINFSKTGLYKVDFTAELHSESANAKTYRFFPRINGTDVDGSTMVVTIHANDERKVTSRTAIMQFAAGDYLEAMFTTDDLDADLHGEAATAYSPAAPSVTLMVYEVDQSYNPDYPIGTEAGKYWIDYVSNYSLAPTQIGSNANGDIYEYTYPNGVAYRLVPTDGVSVDSFYTTHMSGVLSGLIVERGMDI